MPNIAKDASSSNSNSTSSDALPAVTVTANQSQDKAVSERKGTNKRRPGLEDETESSIVKRARIESEKGKALLLEQQSESETVVQQVTNESKSLRVQLLESSDKSIPNDGQGGGDNDREHDDDDDEDDNDDKEAQKERDVLLSRGRLVMSGPVGFERWRGRWFFLGILLHYHVLSKSF